MTVLDTDHASILQLRSGRAHEGLSKQMRASTTDFVTSVVTLEEQMRGWLAWIKSQRDFHGQVAGYPRLTDLVDFYRDWRILPFDAAAASECQRLRREKIRIGTQDLKIAAIALVNDPLLLSANLRDFRKVPGLKVDNWLETSEEVES